MHNIFRNYIFHTNLSKLQSCIFKCLRDLSLYFGIFTVVFLFILQGKTQLFQNFLNSINSNSELITKIINFTILNLIISHSLHPIHQEIHFCLHLQNILFKYIPITSTAAALAILIIFYFFFHFKLLV